MTTQRPERLQAQESAPAAAVPVTADGSDRQVVVDRLRGFALLGVLMVNAPFLLTSVGGISDASMPTMWDRAAGFLTWTLFQAKSYVVFSFLFGYSFAILLDSMRKRGIAPGRAFSRRLLGLAIFGVAHACLLFVGDILVLYAILGGTLLWLRRARDSSALILAGGLLLAQLAVFGLVAQVPFDESVSLDWINRSWKSDGLISATWTRVQVWPAAFGLIFVLQGLLVMALFAVGLVAGRRRWLADVQRHEPILRRIRFWGFLVGLPIQIVAGALGVSEGAAESGRQLLALALMYPTAPILSAAYIAAIALLPERRCLRMAEAEGTMSLSVYLTESLVMTILAAGFGFSLFGMSTGRTFVVALAVWALLSILASLWRRTFGMGPAERLLRRLTYCGLKR